MFGIVLSLAVIFALGLTGAYVLLKSFENFKPGRKKIQHDLKQIKAELKPLVFNLVPWSREEMEQLSLNQINRSAKNKVVKAAKGVFTTIYHEPVIAWAYRGYLGKTPNALLYARTSNQEFVYRLKDGEVEMVIGDQLVGTINASGTLHAYNTSKQLAQVGQQSDELYLPVKINDKLVGSLAKSEWSKKPNPRAFHMLGGMDKPEEELFLSLALLEMLREEVKF